jgi:SAM-dependent methyltransferase
MATGDEVNRAAWNEVVQRPLRYPNERVVTLLARHFRDREANRARRALDVGFGSGRHLSLLLDFGFQVSGIDYAPDAIDVVRRELGDRPGLGDLQTGDVGTADFAPGSFDLVLAWGVAMLRPPGDVTAELVRMREWTAPGGRLFVDFRGRDSWFAGLGEGDGTTSVLDERAGPYAGMTYNFLDRDEAAAVLDAAGWRVEDVEREDLWRERATRRHSWWIFDASKPA